MSDAIKTKEGTLILDSHKLGYHYDRVQSWEAGEKIAPVSIDMALTRSCGAMCSFCIPPEELILMANGSKKPMSAISIGDRVVSFNDGNICESTVLAHWETSPSKSIISLITANDVLRCSLDHPVLTNKGWVAAGKLDIGDLIGTIRPSIRRGKTENAAQNDRANKVWEDGEENSNIGSGKNESIRSHENQQSNEKCRDSRSSWKDFFRKAWRALFKGDERTSSQWKFSSKEPNVRRAKGNVFKSHEGEQPNEKFGNSQQGYSNAQIERGKYCFIESNETNLVRGENNVSTSKNGSKEWDEQNGGKTIHPDFSNGIQVHRRFRILDKQDTKRNLQESGLHFGERQEQDCIITTRTILAQRNGGDHRDAGLLDGWMENICVMDREPSSAKTFQSSGKRSEYVVEWHPILSINDAGCSPVFDLECSPHHNFIASGVIVHNCYAMMQEPQERPNIKTIHALNLLDDFAEIGVRAVSLVSDGESTLSKAYVPFIQHAAELGIDVGNATNAWEWEPEKIDQVLPHLSWVRFTVAAGRPESYAAIMYKGKEHTHVFDRAMSHIKYAVDLKRKLGLKVTLGIQMVLMPEFKDEILDFAKLGVDLGVDYAVIKHCSDDEAHTLGVDYSKYEDMYSLLSQAEAMSTEQTKVIVKWDKIKDGDKTSYNRVYGCNFLLQISGSGLVAPAGLFFNARYSKLHLGNFTEERFIDIFKSDRYSRAMNYLASPAWDAQTMQGTLSIQHYANVALDRHAKGIELIKLTNGDGVLHKNFI